jgi:hypothetical protein
MKCCQHPARTILCAQRRPLPGIWQTQLGIPLPYHRAGPWALRQLQGHLRPSQIQWRSACRSTPAGVDTHQVAIIAFDCPLTYPKRTDVPGLDIVQLTTCGGQTPTASSWKAYTVVCCFIDSRHARDEACHLDAVHRRSAAQRGVVHCQQVAQLCGRVLNLSDRREFEVHNVCVYTQMCLGIAGLENRVLNLCNNDCQRRSIKHHGTMPRSLCHVVAMLGM